VTLADDMGAHRPVSWSPRARGAAAIAADLGRPNRRSVVLPAGQIIADLVGAERTLDAARAGQRQQPLDLAAPPHEPGYIRDLANRTGTSTLTPDD
jgi:hypothetical protein